MIWMCVIAFVYFPEIFANCHNLKTVLTEFYGQKGMDDIMCVYPCQARCPMLIIPQADAYSSGAQGNWS